jgi:hypothetical protein
MLKASIGSYDTTSNKMQTYTLRFFAMLLAFLKAGHVSREEYERRSMYISV